nr:MAG TPA: hypothetical protein [Caudoviricetes sp.]
MWCCDDGLPSSFKKRIKGVFQGRPLLLRSYIT